VNQNKVRLDYQTLTRVRAKNRAWGKEVHFILLETVQFGAQKSLTKNSMSLVERAFATRCGKLLDMCPSSAPELLLKRCAEFISNQLEYILSHYIHEQIKYFCHFFNTAGIRS